MKRIIVLLMLIASTQASIAQSSATYLKLRVVDSLRLGDRNVKEFSTDPSLADSADNILPTQSAVKGALHTLNKALADSAAALRNLSPATPGSNRQVLFNDAGSLGASADLTLTNTDALNVALNLATGKNGTMNFGGTANLNSSGDFNITSTGGAAAINLMAQNGDINLMADIASGYAINLGNGLFVYDNYIYSAFPTQFTSTTKGLNAVASNEFVTLGQIPALVAGTAVSKTPSGVSWDSYNGTTSAAFNRNAGSAPTAADYVGINMPSSVGTAGAQIAFNNNTGYFRTLNSGVYGSWLQLADRDWATNNFAPKFGSDEYIANSVFIVPNTHFGVEFGSSTDGFYVYRNGSNSQSPTFHLYTADTTYGYNIQLDGESIPGIAFQQKDGSNYHERMRLTSGGNLLIGTTSDSGEKLQISGNVSASAAAAANHLVTRQQVTDSLNARNFTTGATIYNGNGTLSGNRFINGNNFNIEFSGAQSFDVSSPFQTVFGVKVGAVVVDAGFEPSINLTKQNHVLIVKTDAGASTITLPSITSDANNALHSVFVIKCIGSNSVTINAAAGETIDGATSQVLNNGECITIVGALDISTGIWAILSKF